MGPGSAFGRVMSSAEPSDDCAVLYGGFLAVVGAVLV